MNHIIEGKIDDFIEQAKAAGQDLSKETAFSYVLVSIFGDSDATYYDIDRCITDGKSDGGIDFVLLDDSEDGKLIIGQSKLTEDIDANTVFAELDKMSTTVNAFENNGNTGTYNKELRKALRDGLDRLPDGVPPHIEYYICTSAHADVEKLLNRLDGSGRELTSESVSIFTEKELLAEIERDWETANTVPEFKFEIDKPNNALEYVSGDLKGAMVNLSSHSIIKLYDQFANKGLFDLNIRKYIRNKAVDSGIKKTLDKKRDRFWFLNNGLTIVCSDYIISGEKITVYDFSIVNGGQTTYLIGNYKGSNSDAFYVPCKVVCDSSLQGSIEDRSLEFFSEIAQATNSQKKISARDLKSNAPEMKSLQRLLQDNGIYMEVKRGESSAAKKKCLITLKNEDFAQIYTSFVYQQPGTARNKKSYMFENEQAYARVFRQNYQKDKAKTDFIVDLIRMYARYLEVEKELKGNLPNIEQNDILANGRCMLFGLLGVVYSVVNEDYSEGDIDIDSRAFCQTSYVPGAFIRNYHDDDLDECIKQVVIESVRLAAETYAKLLKSGECTSASNFLKSDALYQEQLLPDFAHALASYTAGEEIKKKAAFLKRL